jgi:DNA-binding CsgD family transcriptional regulator
LLERDRELERIGAALGAASDGGGSLTVVEGPAGIGKTRLSRAARQEADARGFLALAARGAELELGYPFGVVRQLFEPTLRSAAAAERARLLDGAAELALPAVFPEAWSAGFEPDPTFGVLHGLFWICANLAERQPLLLVIDDAQWCDEPSMRFLGFLVRRVEALPVAVLITKRTGTVGADELADDFAASRFTLRPLSCEAVGSLLRLRGAGPVDEEFIVACSTATGGNPFLLDQLVKALAERNVSFTSSSVDLVETIGPEAVSAAVNRRVSRLGTDAEQLIRAAAVLGDDTQLALAATLAGLDEATGAAAAAALAAEGVLEDARPLRFEHPIVRDAIHASLTTGQRLSLHRQAAEVLAASHAPIAEVAVHLLATEPGAGSRWIVETLAEAARQAVQGGAPAPAVHLLTRALDEPPSDEQRLNLLLELGRLESSVGRPEASMHLEEAYALAVDPVTRGRCALQLGWAHMADHTRFEQVTPLVERAINETALLDRELSLELEAVRVALLSARTSVPAEVVAQLARFGDLEGQTRAECALLAHLAHLRMDAGGSADEAADLAERVAANEELVAEVGFDAAWLLSCILVLRRAERFSAALRMLDLGIDTARRRGSEAGFALGSTVRASVLVMAGDIRAAEADARASLDASPPRSWTRLPAVATLLDVLRESGRLDEAEQLLFAHGATAELPEVRPATVLMLARATLRADQGRWEEALADLESARSRLAPVTSRSAVGLEGQLQRAVVLAALDRHAEARAEADEAVEIAREWGAAGLIGKSLRVQALLSGSADTTQLLKVAIAWLARSSCRLDQARALGDLGATLRRRGERVAAREPLRTALELAHECGGIAVRESARQELAATGVRVQRDTQRGIDSLTPSERRIAERAAAGASNRDIAQALFVTVKTVEMHLGHTYRKLGISSRHELKNALAPIQATASPPTE